MKHKSRQFEMDLGREPFQLVAETTLDGERTAQVQARLATDRAASAKRQMEWAQPRFTRAQHRDRRRSQASAYDADAWYDNETKEIGWVSIGFNPNTDQFESYS